MRIQILTRDSDEDEIAARRCSRGRKQDESFTDPTHCTEHPIKAYFDPSAAKPNGLLFSEKMTRPKRSGVWTVIVGVSAGDHWLAW